MGNWPLQAQEWVGNWPLQATAPCTVAYAPSTIADPAEAIITGTSCAAKARQRRRSVQCTTSGHVGGGCSLF